MKRIKPIIATFSLCLYLTLGGYDLVANIYAANNIYDDHTLQLKINHFNNQVKKWNKMIEEGKSTEEIGSEIKAVLPDIIKVCETCKVHIKEGAELKDMSIVEKYIALGCGVPVRFCAKLSQ